MMMNDNLTDKEQIELLKKFWKDYGKSITIAVLLGLTISYGWRYFQHYRVERGERASLLYAQLQTAVQKKKTESADQYFQLLISRYPHTPYAALAALMNAQEAVSKKQFDVALQRLEWVMTHAESKSFQQIARLRSARVLLSQQQTEKALSLLEAVNDAAYQPLIDDVKGDIYTAMGQLDQAKKAYQSAQNQLQADRIDDKWIKMKAES